MAKRKSINLEGFGHTNPIPVACRLGNLVMSGSILPRDAKGKIPETLDEQCALMFQYVKDVMTEAGGTTDDIIKVNVGMKDSSNREILNKHWIAMFPDAEARPARHTEKKDLPPGILVACEITAVLDR
jgi:enamine deaminase RidA (YjgF/YER057c/UK114 family)